MYDNHLASTRRTRRSALVTPIVATLAMVLSAVATAPASAQDYSTPSVVRKIGSLSEKLELTTNTSRILTLDKNIPRVQVNNPELLAVTPLSATQVQVSAKKPGVTQVNLWDEDNNIHTIDVLIYGDARELQVALQTQFPHASIKVFRYSESLVLTGFVDRPDHISPIMALAQDYAPKVINNINVGGVQQVLLKVKVMEISRTKLRRMATDWAWLDANGSFFSLGVGGLLNQTSNVAGGGFQTVVDTAGKATEFGIVGDDGAFFGFLDWVEQNNLAKVLAEPNLVAVSGRPAQFNVGGEIPIVVPQSLGTASIEFKPFGTQVDFLPIVLGNGNIRLEVRPRISEIDDSRSVIVQDFVIPALTVRQVDTAVEMRAGQTFALAGLVQERTESHKRGLPYISDMPVVGLPFRRVEDEVNEIELLILVTPEFVDPIDSCDAMCGGPGTHTTSPTDRGLYCGGHLEVPTYCNPTQGLGSCGDDGCAGGNCSGCSNCGNGGQMMAPAQVMSEGAVISGGSGYDDGSAPTPATSIPATEPVQKDAAPPIPPQNQLPPPDKQGRQPFQGTPDDITLPGGASDQANATQPPAAGQDLNEVPQGPMPNGAYYPPVAPNQQGYDIPAVETGGTTTYTNPRPYSPPRQPVFMRNASRPYNPQPQTAPSASLQRQNSLIGPIGYDVQ